MSRASTSQSKKSRKWKSSRTTGSAARVHCKEQDATTATGRAEWQTSQLLKRSAAQLPECSGSSADERQVARLTNNRMLGVKYIAITWPTWCFIHATTSLRLKYFAKLRKKIVLWHSACCHGIEDAEQSDMHRPALVQWRHRRVAALAALSSNSICRRSKIDTSNFFF